MTKDNLTRAALAIALTFLLAGRAATDAQPGDVITKDNADKVATLVSPGNFVLVKQGMQMKIVSPGRIEWPPGYRSAKDLTDLSRPAITRLLATTPEQSAS